MTDEFDPLTGELLPKSSKQTDTNPQSPALSDEQLQDKTFLRDLAIKELAAIVMANGGDVKGTPAVRELLDRTEGRPAQAIEQKITVQQEPLSALERAKLLCFYARQAMIDVTPENDK